MEADRAFYERAMARLYRWIMLAGALGTVAVLAFWSWRAAIAFAFGAVASYYNFKWLHEVVEAMGPNARPTRKRVFVLVGLRYALIGVGGYVIVKVFGMNGLAAVVGLFVPVAAVIAEIIFELANGT
jgi:hypothetical protein